MSTGADRSGFRRRGLIWPALVVLLLTSGVGINVAFMMIANDDPHFGVEPRYYEQALNWDRSEAEVRSSVALGWKLTLSQDQSDLVVRLADRNGEPISNCGLSAEAFHNAYSAERLQLTLQPNAEPGQYRTPFRPLHAGLWEFRFRAACGADQFVTRLQQSMSR